METKHKWIDKRNQTVDENYIVRVSELIISTSPVSFAESFFKYVVVLKLSQR